MSREKQNILVAGANGATGQIIIETLQQSEHYQPIAMVRKEDQKQKFEQQDVKTVLADLEEDVSHAMKGIDKVIFAAGSKGKNLKGVDQEGAKKLVDAALDAKVEKYVMLSSIGADNPSVSDELEDYLKAKKNADEYLMKSGLQYTIVRPGYLTNDDASHSVKLEEKLDQPGKISRADVAKTLVEVLEQDVKKNKIFELIKGDTSIEEAVR